MKVVKHIAIGLLLFSVSFSLVFFLTDKTEYHTVETAAREPRVYVTQYGECYHSSGCHYLNRSKIERGLYDARSEGYRACSYCKGRPSGTITVTYFEKEAKDTTGKVAVRSAVFASFTVVIYASKCLILYHISGKATAKKEASA